VSQYYTQKGRLERLTLFTDSFNSWQGDPEHITTELTGITTPLTDDLVKDIKRLPFLVSNANRLISDKRKSRFYRENRARYQKILFLCSQHFTSVGIPPRWQGLDVLAKVGGLRHLAAYSEIRPFLDLYWLQYRGHTLRFQRFADKTEMALIARNLREFDIDQARYFITQIRRKWRTTENLTGNDYLLQFGLTYFVSERARDYLQWAGSAATLKRAALETKANAYQRRHIPQKIEIFKAARLIDYATGNPSPDKTAMLYRQMTGKTVHAPNVVRTLKDIGYRPPHRDRPESVMQASSD
jgi:hypothetical protein